METQRKIRSDAKLKLLAWEIQMEMACKCAEPGMTQLDILAWLQKEHRVKSSTGALSNWLPWFHSRQRVKEREQRVNAILEAEKEMHPELSKEELFEKGQRLFSIISIADEDGRGWTDVQRVEIEKTKVAEKLKTDRQKALEALASEIKGNPEAETLFRQLIKTL